MCCDVLSHYHFVGAVDLLHRFYFSLGDCLHNAIFNSKHKMFYAFRLFICMATFLESENINVSKGVSKC